MDSIDQFVADVAARDAEQLALQAAIATRDELLAAGAVREATLDGELAAALAEIDRLTTVTPPPPVYPSGIAPPSTDLANWRLLFVDGFDTDVPLGQFPALVSDKWQAYPKPWRDTSGHGMYDPGLTVSIAGSVLTQRLWTPADGIPRVSAILPLIHGADRSTWPQPQDATRDDIIYARRSIRMRIPKPIPGYKIAWLWWPDAGSNTQHRDPVTGLMVAGGAGEIDFPETNLDVLTAVSAFMHYLGALTGGDQYSASRTINLADWHTYTIEWSPNLCRFLIDDAVIGATSSKVPNGLMHHVIQSETKLGGAPPPLPTSDGTIEIDWVAFWGWVG